MAVSDKDIDALRRQQSALAEELERTRAELEHTRKQIVAENQEQLADLRRQTDVRIHKRDQRVLAQYESLLEKHTSEQELALEQEFRRYREQYEQVSAQVYSILAQEQKKTEQLLLDQKNFEEAYFERQKFAREQAEARKREAESAIQAVTARVPLEWFLKGHMDLYRSRLLEIAQWSQNGFYEATIGISENMTLSLRLDELEAEERFRRWFHYYTVLYGVLETEKDLLFDAAVRIPEDMTEFRRGDGIQDGRMARAQLDYWSDGKYSELLEQYANVRREMAQFEIDGKPLLEETAMRNYMIAHPEQSEQYQAMNLYSSAMKTAQQLSHAEQEIRQMHNRMRTFEERLRLVRAVRTALQEAGYGIEKVMLIKPAEPLVICFCDSMQIMHFELMLIPLLRRMDNRWLNQAVCFVPDGCDAERISEIRHCLAEVFVTQGISVQYEPMRENQGRKERISIAVSDMQMQINGRLN